MSDEHKKARAIFIEPSAEGGEGLYVAVHSELPGQIHLLPRNRALGHFGLSQRAARALYLALGDWLCGSNLDIPESDHLLELSASAEHSSGFAEAEFYLAGGEES